MSRQPPQSARAYTYKASAESRYRAVYTVYSLSHSYFYVYQPHVGLNTEQKITWSGHSRSSIHRSRTPHIERPRSYYYNQLIIMHCYWPITMMKGPSFSPRRQWCHKEAPFTLLTSSFRHFRFHRMIKNSVGFFIMSMNLQSSLIL